MWLTGRQNPRTSVGDASRLAFTFFSTFDLLQHLKKNHDELFFFFFPTSYARVPLHQNAVLNNKKHTHKIPSLPPISDKIHTIHSQNHFSFPPPSPYVYHQACAVMLWWLTPLIDFFPKRTMVHGSKYVVIECSMMMTLRKKRKKKKNCNVQIHFKKT